MEETKIIKKVVVGIISIIALLILISSFVIVQSGTRGVVLTWGAFHGTIFEPGFHFKFPLAQSVIKLNVQTNKIEVERSEAYSHDLQVVDIHSVINYNLDPQAVGTVFAQYGLEFEGKVLTPNLEASVKQTIAKYTAEELLSKRSEVQDEIQNALKSSVPSPFIITKYALVNEQFSKDFEAAIEAKQVAQQDAEKAKNELTKAQIDAESRIATAKGEAEAIKIQAEAIQQQGGAAYVNLQAINKWNGTLPTYMTGVVPFVNLQK